MYLANRRKSFLDIVTDYKAKYEFEDNGNDVTGNNNASMSNVTYSDTDGVSVALKKYSIYNGTTSYGQVTDHADITDIKTCCAWIYIIGYGESNWGRIFQKGNANTTMFQVTSTHGIGFSKGFTSIPGNWELTTNPFSLLTWYHVAYTYSMDGNIATNPLLYVNGQSIVGIDEAYTPSGTFASDTGDNLYIGNNAANDRAFDGRIDNLRIYNRILSAAEILSIYNYEK